MNYSSSAALSGLPGTNLNVIASLLRDSIIHLCKVSKIYDGWIEIDGIICISGKVEGQQLVVKVHESFRPQDATKKVEGNETFGDNCGFGYEAERSYVCDGNARYSNSERKRKRLDSGSETARSSSAFRQYDHHQEVASVSRSFEIDYKNGVKDLSMKKLCAADQNCKDVVVGSNNTSHAEKNSSSSIFPYAVGSATVAYQVDEMQVSYSDPMAHLGGSFFRPRPLGTNGERWNVSGVVPECRVCGCSFESSEALSDHNEAVHSLFTCLCCFKTFTSRSNLERHSRLHTGHRPYACNICGKAFSRKDHLSNHTTKHAFKCGTCSKRYADRSSLISHYHLDHCAALTNICAYCNKGFSSQEAFEDHVKIHPQFHLAASGEPEETVEEKHEVASQLSTSSKGCRLGKPKPSSLLAFYKHRSLLERANHAALYTCLVCNRSFDHPWKYSSHLSMHPNEVNVFKCCMCLQVCSTLAHLRQHEAAHFSELSDFLGAARLRSLSCSSGDQMFESAHRFQTHLDEHQRMNQLHLGECQRLCLKEQLELQHQAPERQSVDFNCGLCDVRFVNQVSLLQHLEENDHSQATGDTKITKRGKRKQKQPKIAVALDGNNDDVSEVEVVEPESPKPKPLSLRRDRNTPERFDHIQAEQVIEDTRRNDESGGGKIRSDPIRSLMCSRTLALVQRDWEHPNGNNGDDTMEIPKHTDKPSLESYELNKECLGREEATKNKLPASYLHNSPYKFSYGSLVSDGFQSSESYHSFQRCQSSEGFQSVSTTSSDPGCLNNNISSLRNENNVSIPSGPPYLCAFCESKTETFAELDAHCQVEHSRSPCMFCAKTFAQKANRDRHHCLHTGDRPYGCPECDERFSRGDKLKMHRVRMHGVQYPAYSSRQKDVTSSRDYCTSPSPGSYLYEAFGQQVTFLGQTTGIVDLREAEEGDDRREKKAVSSQGDCNEEEPNGVLGPHSMTTRQTEIVVPGDSATNSSSS